MFQLENLVREMQDLEHGVPVRSQKLFLTSIPAAFMGEHHQVLVFIVVFSICFFISLLCIFAVRDILV